MGKSLNPATGEHLKTYQDYSLKEVESILNETQLAQTKWKLKKVLERAQFVKKLGEVLLKNKEKLATLCTSEMGKLSKEAVSEVEKCALACEYFSTHAEKFLAPCEIKTEGQKSFISYQPLGVVLAIMPWNFPYWQVIRFAAPALCAGNGIILKHASNVSGCSLLLEEIFSEAGLPKNLFRSILLSGSEVEEVIKNPVIKAVTLTGSTSAGKSVASTAGSVLKKMVLELGGSDAYLVLEDANLEEAAKTLVKGRLLNAGQSCISPKRIIVDEKVYSPFIKLIESEMKKYSAGAPTDQSSTMGPMARVDLRDSLQDQIDKSIKSGARCLMGGKIPDGSGAYYPPSLLVDVKPGMCAFDEELFGPVVCLIPAQNLDHAIKLANQSEYGLGGGIFTSSHEKALKIATEHMETGGVFINDYLKSDPRLPFGGVKNSGYGRELSEIGIREFTNAKTIYLK